MVTILQHFFLEKCTSANQTSARKSTLQENVSFPVIPSSTGTHKLDFFLCPTSLLGFTCCSLPPLFAAELARQQKQLYGWVAIWSFDAVVVPWWVHSLGVLARIGGVGLKQGLVEAWCQEGILTPVDQEPRGCHIAQYRTG
ncbi:hypothetical protein VNO80_00178 [Phaseolus coccineus]|uniref:Uncharacterized protein n=1 Tax=Phaseolus coccineus TaxID=3886 RepID=A0AAN9RR48_PHACN